jgi:diguanylate cyclase (GGDEF)-like protein
MDDKIVVVDDDPATIYLVGRILQDASDLRFATSGEKALQLVQEFTPDLILLDAELPGMNGFKVFEALQGQPCVLGVPIIFITSHDEHGFEAAALNMGAADFIAKPFTSSRLLARVKTHLRTKRAADGLRRTASTDALTGVGSAHQFDASLEREWLRGLRAGDPLALLLVQLDDFAHPGERQDDAGGNACLQRVAMAIKAVTRRPADLVARRGGGQFAVLLPQTPRLGAQYIARRIIDSVAALNLGHAGAAAVHPVTASIGVSCFDQESSCWPRACADFHARGESCKTRVAEHLLRAAEEALHCAKLAGHAKTKLLDIAECDVSILTQGAGSTAREERSAMWA